MLLEVSEPLSQQSPILHRKTLVSNQYMPELCDTQPHDLLLSISMLFFQLDKPTVDEINKNINTCTEFKRRMISSSVQRWMWIKLFEDYYNSEQETRLLNTVFTGIRGLMDTMWSTINVIRNNKATKAVKIKPKKGWRYDKENSVAVLNLNSHHHPWNFQTNSWPLPLRAYPKHFASG